MCEKLQEKDTEERESNVEVNIGIYEKIVVSFTPWNCGKTKKKRPMRLIWF